MKEPVVLVVATRNAGKFGEIEAMLDDLPLRIMGPGDMREVEETGTTFAENAALKAQAAARHFRLWALGDDSGLQVDALGGEPGVYSSRYGAPEATTDADRNALLLSRLADVPVELRAARFRAAIAIASPEGQTWIAEGSCEGWIGLSPRGDRGFGYDPLFYVPGLDRTMAEIEPELKHRISHRARAMESARRLLQDLLLAGSEVTQPERGGSRLGG